MNKFDDIDWTGYMSRQPRFELRSKTFNFEDYGRYIDIYEKARVEDEARSTEFYKLVKYVKERADDPKADLHNEIVKDFKKKYRLDLIDIPEEFQDLEVTDEFQPRKLGRTAPKRKRVLTKSNKDLKGYDAWRVYDREFMIMSDRDTAVAKLMIPPALLKRAFGTPNDSHIGYSVTGIYHFEDKDLSMYCLHDYK